ncbi:hypothetical protein JIN84_21095 [Luteolibacter yonseiensis]|uniref:Lipoprotein n=1 Tax=Luteolibacter yonseiensis TaxID=1144680 RepID=A0A934R499_9BACT|nr:hypothetical protein [Luteolibacter yonseiensis]MBK1818133.1 hypothetical protein [Luteolibacter yonseiensis]
MKHALVLLCAALLPSCIHTSVAPVANPEGVPVVIRIPGVRPGQKPAKEHIAAMEKKIEEGIVGKSAPAKPDPAVLAMGTIGRFGEVRTKRGEKFAAYAPMVVIRSTYPEEMVDRAAGLTAAAYYRSAKKHFQVTPVTELASPPPKNKP